MRLGVCLLFLLCFLGFCLEVLTKFLIPLPLIQETESRLYLDRHGRFIRLELNRNQELRLRTAHIPEPVRNAVLALEDRYFDWHPGFNPFSMMRAAWHNLRHQKKIGASTISMQVARMGLRLPRTIDSKIQELLVAIELELSFSKDEILGMWLNQTPYGFNIVGFRTAALLYFGMEPELLSHGQIALLVSLPKNPSPTLNSLTRLYRRVLMGQRDKGLSSADINRALDEDWPKKLFDLNGRLKRPRQPPTGMHYLRFVLKQNPSLPSEFRTSLDLNLQRELDLSLRQAVDEWQHLGVTHSAGAILAVTDHSVHAWSGSQDFLGQAGQNDLLLSLRSPGSTLKPFVAIQALNEGIVTTASGFLDIPQSFSGYFPRNFDEGFRGLISLSDALTLSLNVPFAELQSELQTSLYQILKNAEFYGLKPASTYGGTLVLGGGSHRPYDLLRLYAAMASQGRIFTKGIAKQFFAPEGVHLVTETLKGVPLPPPYLYNHWQDGKSDIVLKTGTSDRSRDLYTIGFNGDWVLLLWMGRFDGKATLVPSARVSVAPAFARLMRRLPTKRLDEGSAVSAPRLRLITGTGCQEPRFISASECQKLKQVTIIPGTTKLHYCPPLRPEQILWYGPNNLPRSCYSQQELDLAPQIIEPWEQEVALSSDSPLPIRCVSARDETLRLYADDRLLGSVQAGQTLWAFLPQGSQEIRCIDVQGRVSKRSIRLNKI